MHYLFVLTAPEWSGTARVFTTAARALAARGHDVTVVVEPESTVERVVSEAAVVAGDGGRPAAPRFHVEPLSLVGGWLRAAWRLRAVVRLRRADVVFVHTDHEQLAAAAAFRLGSRAPVVRRLPAGQAHLLRGAGRMATRIAPTVLMFPSEAELRATPVPRRAVASIVTPLGIPEPGGPLTPRFSAAHASGIQERPEGKESQSAPGDAFATDMNRSGTYVVCVHDASSRSRSASAIRTIAMLAPRHPGLGLVVIGESTYDDDLRMQAAALDVLHRVSFLGDRADELYLMRGARLGWVVADGDTAAYALLDFMRLGVPVLAGQGTVAERYVLPQITGILLPPDDAFVTASVVAGLLSSDTQRTMMGDAARARASREFSERAMIDGFERAAAALR